MAFPLKPAKNCSNDDIFISCDDRIGKMLLNICMSAVALSLRWANRGPWASCTFSPLWSIRVITRSWVWIPLEAEFISWLYCASLQRAFHYQSSSSPYDLNNVERGVKLQSIVLIIFCLSLGDDTKMTKKGWHVIKQEPCLDKYL